MGRSPRVFNILLWMDAFIPFMPVSILTWWSFKRLKDDLGFTFIQNEWRVVVGFYVNIDILASILKSFETNLYWMRWWRQSITFKTTLLYTNAYKTYDLLLYITFKNSIYSNIYITRVVSTFHFLLYWNIYKHSLGYLHTTSMDE